LGEDKFLLIADVSFYVANKYKSAKLEFCHSGADSVPVAGFLRMGGMYDAHMPGTYWFLATKL